MKELLVNAKAEGVVDVYDKCKGNDFNGFIFVKFGSTEKRDAGIKVFNDGQNTFSETRTFMNRDLPIQHRSKLSFLNGFKKLLIKWKIENVSFNDDSFIISVAGVPVLKVMTEGLSFQIIWLDHKWEEWKELTGDPEFKELAKVAADKLSKALQSKGKGKNTSD